MEISSKKKGGPLKDRRFFLFVKHPFLDACQFLFHRIDSAGDGVFECVCDLFNDEIVSGKMDVKLGLLAFLDILKGNFCLRGHSGKEELLQAGHFLLDECGELVAGVEFEGFELISIFTSVFCPWMGVSIYFLQSFDGVVRIDLGRCQRRVTEQFLD